MSHPHPIPAPDPEPMPDRKKKGGVLKLIGGIIVGLLLVFVLLGACSAMFASGPDPEPQPDPGPVVTESEEPVVKDPAPTEAPGDTLTLEATSDGSSPAYLSWGDMNSNNSVDFTGQWSKEIELENVSDYWSVTVTGSEDSSTVTCKITKGDEVIQEAKGTGQFGSASCSYPSY